MAATTDNEVSTANGSETRAKESFSDAIRRVVRPRDVIAILFPAALFLGVGVLPPAMREQLAFSTADPELLTALTSNFAHADSTHLFRNLTAYLFVIPTVYLLSVLADRRQLFYTVFVVVFTVFPVVLSGLNLAVPRNALSLGASGLTLSFVGYLPVALAEYVRRRFNVVNVVRRILAGGVFFLGLVIVIPLVAAAVQRVLAVALTVVALLAVVVYGVGLRRSGIDRSTLRGPPPGFLELGIWSTAILVAALIAAFPTDPLSEAGVVNTYTHFLGYALGFLSSYLAVLLIPKFEQT
ncbi:hypothetical protein CK500_15935 [Halorubrum salipaludis]|uniref:Peptidase S54 rhomboid domain-containing protein n=1 Tax=Halorubrum salipaludis TaxID=2032630 RepID=A0A2A2F5P3_9EURY|nr:hypothetical protein [Halorubrum salipaludis]PAU79997.1 hypothetical protein CK500_15935 [Halorubrum salipaludis]